MSISQNTKDAIRGSIVRPHAAKEIIDVLNTLPAGLVDLAADVTGTLPGANGGTGVTVTPNNAGGAVITDSHNLIEHGLSDGGGAYTVDPSGYRLSSNGGDTSWQLDWSALTLAGAWKLGGANGASATAIVNAVSLQNSTYNYAADAGSTDDYAITLSPAVTAYAAGQMFLFKANTANTGACTLNVNGLGAKAIKKKHDQDPADNDIEVGQIVLVVYDGTSFQMQSQIAN